MSSQQSVLIVELADSLQWLPNSARVLAWCRLLKSTEALLDSNITDPLIALIPYLKDVNTSEFAKYHDSLADLMKRVPSEHKQKLHSVLKKNKSILPDVLKNDLRFSDLIFGGH